ncbi:MAG: RusA family crossover junction endodeoxyribonuclease, partial [Nitrospirota bacterium]|nr:RusA family crossover junction endodeoxyribonuclease [Nitrospirota bacterium]
MRLTSYRQIQPLSAEPSQLAHAILSASFPTSRRRSKPVLLHVAEPLGQATVSATSLSVTLPVPPSINHQYATVNGRRVLSALGRGYKAQVAQLVLLALAQSPHKASLRHSLGSGPLALSIRFHFVSPLRRDVDGGLKIAQDALCEALGLNDNRIVEIHLYKEQDSANPR